MSMESRLPILVDHDGCPKQATEFMLRQSAKQSYPMILVANRMPWGAMPAHVSIQIVSGGMNAADDWIADVAVAQQIVVTSDIPLADRVIKKGALVLTYTGALLDQNNIGERLAIRNLSTELRSAGSFSKGGGGGFDLGKFAQGWQSLVAKRIG